MKKKILITSILILSLAGITTSAKLFAHCQVPCGIYDDAMRMKMIAEHITTIEKAIDQITKLSSQATPNYNQIVRWVTNKEKHAEELSDIVSYYFLAQRIKPVGAKETESHGKYLKKLEALHLLLVYAMKAKQTTESEWVSKLRDTLETFKSLYSAE
jgi:nickel superoxide dismutase